MHIAHLSQKISFIDHEKSSWVVYELSIPKGHCRWQWLKLPQGSSSEWLVCPEGSPSVVDGLCPQCPGMCPEGSPVVVDGLHAFRVSLDC